jgi:hypothetical protein
MYTSAKARARAAQMIVAKHYGQGNQLKSRKAVWRRYVAPAMYVLLYLFGILENAD